MDYDKTQYKVWTWKHPVMLHWIINPGLAVNELVFGQRVAKTVLIEKDRSRTLSERTIIPCPHCGTLHSGLKWAGNTAYKNWFGLYCDHCGKTIPCLTNLTSYLLLAVTSPFWIWFYKSWKKNWLQRQPVRYENLDLEQAARCLEGHRWIPIGLLWGLVMYIFMLIVMPILLGKGISLRAALIGIPLWVVGGFFFGYTVKLINRKHDAKGRTA